MEHLYLFSGGEDEHGRVPTGLAQLPDKLHAVQIRHHEVAHYEIDVLLVKDVERIATVCCRDRLVPVLAQYGAQELVRVAVVFDHQDSCHACSQSDLPISES